ncbi:MAG TPA: BrnT family toxin [Pyrinomonadaceae bacterium]|nr:BrnT family toxin [Pyrinomonadaceae bacterium]
MSSLLMNIQGIIWLRTVIDKLAFKHHVETHEVEELLVGKPRFRLVEKGEREGENIYMALGQTDAGRYLTVVFIHKQTKEALILSARDMADKERKMYGRK